MWISKNCTRECESEWNESTTLEYVTPDKFEYPSRWYFDTLTTQTFDHLLYLLPSLRFRRSNTKSGPDMELAGVAAFLGATPPAIVALASVNREAILGRVELDPLPIPLDSSSVDVSSEYEESPTTTPLENATNITQALKNQTGSVNFITNQTQIDAHLTNVFHGELSGECLRFISANSVGLLVGYGVSTVMTYLPFGNVASFILPRFVGYIPPAMGQMYAFSWTHSYIDSLVDGIPSELTIEQRNELRGRSRRDQIESQLRRAYQFDTRERNRLSEDQNQFVAWMYSKVHIIQDAHNEWTMPTQIDAELDKQEAEYKQTRGSFQTVADTQKEVNDLFGLFGSAVVADFLTEAAKAIASGKGRGLLAEVTAGASFNSKLPAIAWKGYKILRRIPGWSIVEAWFSRWLVGNAIAVIVATYRKRNTKLVPLEVDLSEDSRLLLSNISDQVGESHASTTSMFSNLSAQVAELRGENKKTNSILTNLVSQIGGIQRAILASDANEQRMVEFTKREVIDRIVASTTAELQAADRSGRQPDLSSLTGYLLTLSQMNASSFNGMSPAEVWNSITPISNIPVVVEPHGASLARFPLETQHFIAELTQATSFGSSRLKLTAAMYANAIAL